MTLTDQVRTLTQPALLDGPVEGKVGGEIRACRMTPRFLTGATGWIMAGPFPRSALGQCW